MAVYTEALKDKKLAANILLPLIEFEFVFIGDDSPSLVQTFRNKDQLQAIFEVCKQYGWTTTDKIMKKRDDLYFRLNRQSFEEIYKIAGPFADKERNEWAHLLLERLGKIGGYRKKERKTEEKVLELFKKTKKPITVGKMCLELRLLPTCVREAVRNLYKSNSIRRRKIGRTVYWEII